MRGGQSLTLIACEVFRTELEYLKERYHYPVALEFLQQELHNTPDVLRADLQASIDRLENSGSPPDRILLGYGLCGRGLTGVTSKRAVLVIPRVHDCIPLLLGVDQDASGTLSQSGGTYWFSPGWLGCSQVAFIKERGKRHAEYAQQFGKDNADYLMEVEGSWLKSYTSGCLVRWEAFGERYRADAIAVSADAGLPYREEDGQEGYLRALLDGGHDPDRFLHLSPGFTLDVGGNGCVEAVSAKQDG